MKRNQEAIRTKSNAAHAAITELTNLALIAAEKADKAETAEVRNPVVSPEAYSRIEDEAIRLAKKVKELEESAKRWEYECNCAQSLYNNTKPNHDYWKAECEKARIATEDATDDRDDLAHEIHRLNRHIEAMEIGRRNDRILAEIENRDEEKDRRIDQLELALCEAQDKLRAEIAEHQRTKELLRCARNDQDAWKTACVAAREISQDLDADIRCMRSERDRLMAHLKQIEELARSK